MRQSTVPGGDSNHRSCVGGTKISSLYVHHSGTPGRLVSLGGLGTHATSTHVSARATILFSQGRASTYTVDSGGTSSQSGCSSSSLKMAMCESYPSQSLNQGKYGKPMKLKEFAAPPVLSPDVHHVAS